MLRATKGTRQSRSTPATLDLKLEHLHTHRGLSWVSPSGSDARIADAARFSEASTELDVSLLPTEMLASTNMPYELSSDKRSIMSRKPVPDN
jgi:hypothetical protein